MCCAVPLCRVPACPLQCLRYAPCPPWQGEYLKFPRYLEAAGGAAGAATKLQPADTKDVPPELTAQAFPLDKTVLTKTFDGLSSTAALKCYSKPGPADPQLYCKQSKVNGYWLGWRWFVGKH